VAVDRCLGSIDGGGFGFATPAFQHKERDDDEVADRLYALVEQECRGHKRWVLAIRLVILVLADETSYGRRLGQWTK
jgi:hypothetical protein